MFGGVDEEKLLEVARIIGGEVGVELIKALKEEEDLTVEEISERTGIQINIVRRLLYKFYNHRIVASKRFRDPETGWFIFQWRLQPDLVEAFIQGMKKKILKKLRERLEYEQGHDFYHCHSEGCPRLTFEEAMEVVFRCPICGDSLKPFDNTRYISFLKRKIEELQEEMG
jgi:transcription initiation factor TFIIE subunit alpha